MLERLEASGLGVARARVAALLGDPDPFPVRAALAADPDAHVDGGPGEVLDRDAVEAALVAAGHHPALAGLFAFHPPGAQVRAVAVDDPARRYLRWRAEPTPPVRVGGQTRWTTVQLGDEPTATIRCLCPLPGGLALGSDYGLSLWRGGRFEPFPWPRGARREARRVEAMAVHAGVLHVATQQALVTWDQRGEPKTRKHGADLEGGFDDLLCLLSVEDRLLVGWRTHFEGGAGPADTISLGADPAGVVYAGTRDGGLHVIDGGGPTGSAALRRFTAGGKGRPVRHLAFAEGALWVAAAGALHHFDGACWQTLPGEEPTALGVDERGRLWAIRDGRLHVWTGEALTAVAADLDRPWCLGFTPGAVWVGGVGAVVRLEAR